jgi:hypothetical protein
MTFLGEAHLVSQTIEKARDLAEQALTITREAKYLFAVGWAQRSLGRIALARGVVSEAETYLTQAFETFASIQARFALRCCRLDLAKLADAQANREAVAMHLRQAHRLFQLLRLPRYVERTTRLASRCGVSL